MTTSVPNNGNYFALVPVGSATTQARVKVQAADNIFFDISNQNFTIQAPTAPDYIVWSLEDENSGRGRKYHRVIIDECEKARNFQKAWQNTIRATLSDYKGDCYFLSTPKIGKTFFKEIFKLNKPDWNSFKFTTYDNPYISNEEIENIREMTPTKIFETEYLAEDVDVMSENAFFTAFSRDKHFTLDEYEPIRNQPLILSFDFNINPTTLLVSQYDATKGELHIFDLFLTTPNTIKGLSPIEAACELFNKKYIESGLFTAYQLKVTGDASGNAGSADRKIADTYYSNIERSLKTKNIVIRRSNLEHVTSGRMINSLLRGMPKGSIYIHGLIALVSDIEIAYSDENGTLNKAKKEFGLHIVDAFRYLFDMVYLMPTKNIRDMEMKVNALILQYEARINRRNS